MLLVPLKSLEAAGFSYVVGHVIRSRDSLAPGRFRGVVRHFLTGELQGARSPRLLAHIGTNFTQMTSMNHTFIMMTWILPDIT